MYAELFPYEYCNEIMDIANANDNADWAVGLDMFINNVKDVGSTTDMYHYHGADNLNYKALNAIYSKLTESELVNRKYAYRTVYGKKAKGVYARLRRARKDNALRALFLADLVAGARGILPEKEIRDIETAARKAGYVVENYMADIKAAENAKG